MVLLLLLPALLQMLAMAVDEFVFHRRRGLPRWERLGHPLDTLTAAACYGWLAFAPPSESSTLGVYVGLCAFSCLFITKDEFVHAPYPTWTAVGVTELARPGALIEVKVTARLRS